jgi:predicted nucleic acid-binding protein
LDFVQDVFIDGAVALASILPEETQSVMNAVNEYNVDFDDAYQLAAADKYDLVIVSFDSDFDRTSRGKKTPAEILATI